MSGFGKMFAHVLAMGGIAFGVGGMTGVNAEKGGGDIITGITTGHVRN
jgi:hypothetical protein